MDRSPEDDHRSSSSSLRSIKTKDSDSDDPDYDMTRGAFAAADQSGGFVMDATDSDDGELDDRACNVNNSGDVRMGEEDGEAIEGYQQDSVAISDKVSDGTPSVRLPGLNLIAASGVRDHDLCFLFHYAP